MKPERLPPPCNMVIRWEGKCDKDVLSVLKREVKLVGAREPCDSFTLFVDPNDDPLEESKGVAFVSFLWNFNFS